MGLTRITPRSVLLLAILGAVIVVTAISTLAAVGQTSGPGDDPSQESIPEIQVPDSAQSMFVRVFFNSPAVVEVVETGVSDWPAPGRAGGPPLIGVDVFDDAGALLESFNAWHPLWVEHGREGDDEEDNDDPQRGFVAEQSGEGVFIFPFYPNVGVVEISDVELGQMLVEVDAHQIVVDYCFANGDDPACDDVVVPSPTPVPCPADVNGDGKLSLLDVFALARALGSKPGDSRWNPAADLNGDGVVNWGDFWILLQSFHDPACR